MGAAGEGVGTGRGVARKVWTRRSILPTRCQADRSPEAARVAIWWATYIWRRIGRSALLAVAPVLPFPLVPRKPVLRLLAGLVLVALVGCGNGEAPSASVVSHSAAAPAAAPYRFDTPSAQFDLPGRLDEISGLTALDATRLGAVQDEDGVLFVIDAATGRDRARARLRQGR